MSLLRDWLAARAPWLGPPYRYFRAIRDSLAPCRDSYSQHGEDQYLWGQLSNYDLRDGVYVDVGASHPTTISNTYLFYRKGSHGVTIDPNHECVILHRRIRPRDIVIGVGCANQVRVAAFRISKTPVLSRFQHSKTRVSLLDREALREEFLPLLPLDIALMEIPIRWIYLLSIDVEGLDLEVLKGGNDTLGRTLFVCVEADTESERVAINAFLAQRGFALQRTMVCNQIFKNTDARFDTYLNEI